MCDVESACYLPLLEETGYIPKHRYSYGPELRSYAELVAAKYHLSDRAVFGATIQTTSWNDHNSEWETTISKEMGDGSVQTISLRSDFFVLSSGILNRPKLPKLSGMEKFKGHMFHTSRWDYNYTGGTPDEPALENLKDKKVAFLGTGATAIQVVPQIAKWVERLTVLQRTPSAVSHRGQRPVEAERFRQEIQTHKGWQRERRENLALWLSNPSEQPEKNLVDDGWTHFPSMAGLVGSPRAAGLTAETAPKYVEMLHVLDMPRQNCVRQRVLDIVKDRVTAASLQPWYPGWCKRPCFHDDYLEAFNLSNVSLADTDGRGIDGFSENGVLVNGKEIEADVVILGTGFETFTAGSPAFRAGITVKGRNGLSMDEKWAQGPRTLHGVFTKDFPNLILSGFTQAGSTVNVVHTVDVLATHAAHIVAATKEKVTRETNNSSQKFTIEPTETAEFQWAMRVAEGAYGYAAMPGCTPSYATAEGARGSADSPESALKMAQSLAWSKGILDFINIVEEWEAKGDLCDLDIRAI